MICNKSKGLLPLICDENSSLLPLICNKLVSKFLELKKIPYLCTKSR